MANHLTVRQSISEHLSPVIMSHYNNNVQYFLREFKAFYFEFPRFISPFDITHTYICVVALIYRVLFRVVYIGFDLNELVLPFRSLYVSMPMFYCFGRSLSIPYLYQIILQY